MAVTAALFTPSLGGELVYDDVLLVDRSPATVSVGAALRHGLEPFWAFNNQDTVIQRGIWRPLTNLALSVGRMVGGGSPWGFHLVSILLHLVAVLAVFRLATRLFATRGTMLGGAAATLGGAAAALLFAVHPAQVEAVAWISAVNDPLWGALGLLGLIAYERAASGEGPRARGYGAAGLWFFLALASKEQAIVLPLLALVLDLSARRRPAFGAWAALAAPVVLWYGLRVWVFKDLSAGLFRDHGDFGFDAGRLVSFRLELAGGFLENLLLPLKPAVFRPVNPVVPEGSNQVLVGGLWLVGAVILALVALARGWRVVLAGVLTALVVFAPFVVSPDSAGLFPESDRYLYMAVFGAALAATGALAKWGSGFPLLAAIPVALGLGWISWAHQDTFQDELAFRDAAVAAAPNSPNVLWGAGRAYINEYIRTRDKDVLAQAYVHYLNSLKAVTVYGDGSFVDDQTRPFPERIARLEHLILETPANQRRLDPTVFATADDRYQATLGQIYSNLLRIEVSKDPDLDYPLELALGAAKVNDGSGSWGDRPELNALIAEIHNRRGELQPAKEAIARAIKARPADLSYQQQLGRLLVREGDFEAARTTFQRASELAPEDLELRLDHIAAALEAKRFEIAERELKVVLGEMDPDNVRALVLRASLETSRSRPTEALVYLDKALALEPNRGEAHKQRGKAMYQLGDLDGALESFSNAARLLPEDFQSHYNVTSLLLGIQPGPEAPPEARKRWLEQIERVMVRAYMLSPRTGQEQLALQQQLQGIYGENPDRAMSLATTLHGQGRDALALIWINIATENQERWTEEDRDQNLVLAYTLQGMLRRRAGQAVDAVNSLRNAVLIEPDHFEAQFELGDLLMAMGRLDEAEPHVIRSLELLPESKVAADFRAAVKGTLEGYLAAIQEARGG